jgi:hypothetical protein
MADDRPEGTFTQSAGFVELMNEHHEPVGARQMCTFQYDLSSNRVTFELLTDHDFVISAAEGTVSYVALRDNEDVLMFMVRIPDRVIGTGIFGIGPHRSGLVRYRRFLP